MPWLANAPGAGFGRPTPSTDGLPVRQISRAEARASGAPQACWINVDSAGRVTLWRKTTVGLWVLLHDHRSAKVQQLVGYWET